MMKKRNRTKQSTTLERRLAKFAAALQQQAKALTPGSAEAVQLQKRIQSCEAALRLNDSLNAGR
jgi:hypothetical protein